MLKTKEKKAVLDHAFHKVLGLTDINPLVREIRIDGIVDISDFVTSFSSRDIVYLQYSTDNGLKMDIPTWHQDYIKIFT